MIRIECRCGETYYSDEQNVGRRIGCKCGRFLTIEAASSHLRREPQPSNTSGGPDEIIPLAAADGSAIKYWPAAIVLAIFAIGLIAMTLTPDSQYENQNDDSLGGSEQKISDSYVPDSVALESKSPPFSLPTGLELIGRNSKGYGTLKVDNGSGADALVRLKRMGSGQTTKLIYVQAGDTLTVKRIPSGTYWLLFAFGEDWDTTTARFNKALGYSRFQDAFDFTTERTSTGVQYSVWSVTLNPVVGGTAKTADVEAAEFWAEDTASVQRAVR